MAWWNKRIWDNPAGKLLRPRAVPNHGTRLPKFRTPHSEFRISPQTHHPAGVRAGG